jgi:transcriptional regulator with XRE-family HTH domain
MARGESPLDSPGGALQRFAHGLNSLREKRGLTYRQLAAKAGYSRTTLSDAAKGKDLPTVDVIRAYVEACGGDEEEWARRWRELNTLFSAQEGPARRAATLSVHAPVGCALTPIRCARRGAVALSRGGQGGVLRYLAQIAAASSVKACGIRCRGSTSRPSS